MKQKTKRKFVILVASTITKEIKLFGVLECNYGDRGEVHDKLNTNSPERKFFIEEAEYYKNNKGLVIEDIRDEILNLKK